MQQDVESSAVRLAQLSDLHLHKCSCQASQASQYNSSLRFAHIRSHSNGMIVTDFTRACDCQEQAMLARSAFMQCEDSTEGKFDRQLAVTWVEVSGETQVQVGITQPSKMS